MIQGSESLDGPTVTRFVFAAARFAAALSVIAASAPKQLVAPFASASSSCESINSVCSFVAFLFCFLFFLYLAFGQGDATAHKLSHGVATDYGYYAIYGSLSNVQNAIANVYGAVNAVYLAQFNGYLEIGSTLIYAVADTSVAWNWKSDAGQQYCRTDQVASINAHLDQFTAWRTSKVPKNMGTWHLLTNCWKAPGTVGLAWLGVVCSSQYGTGVSSWTNTHWLVVAHEFGHVLNSPHSFQEGQGKTGGIMDYVRAAKKKKKTTDRCTAALSV